MGPQDTALLDYAESNDIVTLFPQTFNDAADGNCTATSTSIWVWTTSHALFSSAPPPPPDARARWPVRYTLHFGQLMVVASVHADLVLAI